MPNLFLSHSSVDKPFVEKLAKDLGKIGINIWYDKWEIKVGDSITWKIENGIRENEFFCIVLSPESMNSEWVMSELGAAWSKQMTTKKIGVLPILYRDCNIPSFLVDRKYADFRKDYDKGLEELLNVFGIEITETISGNNWRKFIGKHNVDWKFYQVKEFEKLVTILVDRAHEYKWSAWVGGTKNPLSITLSTSHNGEGKYITIKLKTGTYMTSLCEEINPNRIKSSDFTNYVGNSINECEEFVWRHMEDFKREHGDPVGTPFYHSHKYVKIEETVQSTKEFVKKFNWYKGDKL
jgi:hypothetical protein